VSSATLPPRFRHLPRRPNDSLALKVTYDLLYRNQPLPGLEKLDTTFGVGVQATF